MCMKKEKMLHETQRVYDFHTLLSGSEAVFLINNIRKLKHRLLLDFARIGLTLEEIVNVKLNELDLISGFLYISSTERFIQLPKQLHQLIKLYLRNNTPSTFLFETKHGPLKEEAAEKIIFTLALRYLGKAIPHQILRLPPYSQKSFLHEQTSFQVHALPLSLSQSMYT